MIEIDFIRKGAFCEPKRELTEEELNTVTSKVTNGSVNKIIYYQGDEPVEPIVVVEEKHPLIEILDSRPLSLEDIQKVKELLQISEQALMNVTK